MGVQTSDRFRRGLGALALTSGVAVAASACIPTGTAAVPVPTTAPPAPPTTIDPAKIAPWPVMGAPRFTAEQLVAWYRSKRIVGATNTVPVEELARLFIEEGRIEGVAGDLAFVQAMIETGWLRFSQRMPASNNNFSGIGAVDGGTGSSAFDTPALGVRAQIQYLKAYATPNFSLSMLANPPVSSRLLAVANWVKGKGALWSNFGNGVWATDPNYATLMDKLYRDLAARYNVRVK